jgi:hypothetical protein
MISIGYVVCLGEVRNAYTILVGKLQGKRSFRSSRHRFPPIKIKIYLREISLKM